MDKWRMRCETCIRRVGLADARRPVAGANWWLWWLRPSRQRRTDRRGCCSLNATASQSMWRRLCGESEWPSPAVIATTLSRVHDRPAGDAVVLNVGKVCTSDS